MSHVRMRTIPGFREMTVPPSSGEDLNLINSLFARVPVEADDIHVRQARVAHNRHDRTLERFRKADLERFAETLPGKSLLPGHDTRATPIGRWFRAETRTRTEEFPELIRQPIGKSADGGKTEIVPGFAPVKTRVTWLEAGFYFSVDASTEGMRKNIDSGVWQDVSIGFAYDDLDCDVCKGSYFKSDCPHYRGQVLDDGTLVTLTYAGDPALFEAREASIVYLGAQQHAELMKSLRSGKSPEELARTPYGEDLAALKELEALARICGCAQKVWAFPGLKVCGPSDGGPAAPPQGGEGDRGPSIGGAGAANAAEEAGDMGLLEQARKLFSLPETAGEDEALRAMETAKGQATAGADAVSKLGAVEAKVGELKPLAEIGEKALTTLREQIVADDLKLTGQAENAELTEVLDLLVSGRRYDRLKEISESKRAEVLAKFPAGHVGQAGQSGDNAVPPKRSTDEIIYAAVN